MRTNERHLADTTLSAESGPRILEHAVVAECAYYIWQAQGCPDGRSEAIWYEAETILRSNGAELPHAEEPSRIGRKRTRMPAHSAGLRTRSAGRRNA